MPEQPLTTSDSQALEKQAAHRWPLRVYIEDTDAGGIVFYANYLKYMERARTEWLRALGFNKPAMPAEQRLLIVASISVNYSRSAVLDDELIVETGILKLARSYIDLEQVVYRNGEQICTANVRLACVDSQSLRPKALPEALSQVLNA